MPLLHKGDVIVNDDSRYSVQRKLGEGQFAEVWEVKRCDSSAGRLDLRYALKLEKRKDRNTVKQEYKALKKLSGLCSQVVTVENCGMYDDRFYMVLQLLGETLYDARKQTGGRLDVPTVKAVGLSTLGAIEQVHQQHMIHRDIKPANFVIDPPNAAASKGSWLLIDFGLARRYTDDNGAHLPPRSDASFRGSTTYASVHAHQDEDLSRRDDLWSWLYMLAELLDGGLPWRLDKDGGEHVQPDKCWVQQQKEACIQQPSLLTRTVELPEPLAAISGHLASLAFEDTPDYDYLRRCLQQLPDPQVQLHSLTLPAQHITANGQDQQQQQQQHWDTEMAGQCEGSVQQLPQALLQPAGVEAASATGSLQQQQQQQQPSAGLAAPNGHIQLQAEQQQQQQQALTPASPPDEHASPADAAAPAGTTAGAATAKRARPSAADTEQAAKRRRPDSSQPPRKSSLASQQQQRPSSAVLRSPAGDSSADDSRPCSRQGSGSTRVPRPEQAAGKQPSRQGGRCSRSRSRDRQLDRGQSRDRGRERDRGRDGEGQKPRYGQAGNKAAGLRDQGTGALPGERDSHVQVPAAAGAGSAADIADLIAAFTTDAPAASRAATQQVVQDLCALTPVQAVCAIGMTLDKVVCQVDAACLPAVAQLLQDLAAYASSGAAKARQGRV